MKRKTALAVVALMSLLLSTHAAERPPRNYDESKVPPYTLPDPLICNDGRKVLDAEAWQTKRRPEILEAYRSQMHGRSPARPPELKFEVTSTDTKALDGLATRKEIEILVSGSKDGPVIHMLLYTPNAVPHAPAFVGVNFDGNHTIHTDPSITICKEWWNDAIQKKDFYREPKAARGKASVQWPVETLLKRGYALATVPRNDIEPDYPEGWRRGIRGYFLQKSGKTEFAPDDWGAIGAWAWTLSRALDYLETDASVDAKRVAVMGHSRMGKTALWAGAQDERFALVISNNSGECGAALSRRWFGEMISEANEFNPHWFCANFKQYSNDESKLPFDAHELIALSAPRPVYVASAELDKGADPHGEFLATKAAEPVYRLFGKDGLGVAEMPEVNHPVGSGAMGYHIRTGKHDVTAFDWEQYLAFADRNLAAVK
ncbi:MAG TPA: acetylxylan esterase [Planctomycetota bacterium]|nr:acetylxylan esterase [Planctomycetota bacterium]